jgi:hypothetical protein
MNALYKIRVNLFNLKYFKVVILVRYRTILAVDDNLIRTCLVKL